MTSEHRRGPDRSAAVFLDGRDRILSLAAVIMAAFGVGISFGIAFPLTSLTLESWEAAKWQIGIAGAAPSLSVLLALPFVPRLVARLGLVPAIGLGCLGGAFGFLALGLFPSVASWIVIRFLMSAGLALPWLAGETWINLVTHEATRGRAIAIYAISFFSGYSAGPLILDWVGIVGPAPFIAGALGMALAGLPILIAARLAPDVSHAGNSGSLFAAIRLVPMGMAGGFIGGFAEMTYLSLLPNVALSGGLDQSRALQLTSLMTIGGVILQYPIGWLADKAAKLKVTIALALALAILTAALPWVFADRLAANFTAFLIGGAILGFYTLGLAIIGEESSVAELATANAAFLIMYQAGAIFGPAAAGAAMTALPVGGFVGVVSAFMLLATGALIEVARRHRQSS